jgi:transposase, IS5 family
VEEALYDSLAMRDFVGVDLGREPVPDETTVCRFRHLLETHDLGQQRSAGTRATVAGDPRSRKRPWTRLR